MNLLDNDFSILDLPQFKSSNNKIDGVNYKNFKKISKYIQNEIVDFLNLKFFDKEKKIIILLKTGVKAYASMVACLDLKICYVPLNIENSIDYNSEIISRVKPNLIITDNQNLIKEFEAISIFIDYKQDLNYLQRSTYFKEIKDSKNDSLAYIIFTSGTTGKPKGVEVSRSNLFNYLEYCYQNMPYKKNSRVLQTASISFDLSVLSIYPPLIRGSTIVSLKSNNEELIPWKIVNKEKINIITSVPSFISLINASNKLKLEYFVEEIKFIFCGEPLNYTLVSKIFNNLPCSRIFNLYGPTEVTVSCSEIELNKNNFESYSDGVNLSIGRPIKSHKFFIKKFMDKDGLEKQTLIIRGPQVARGYFNNKELTNERFQKEIQKLNSYDTGDNVYLRDDGNYFFKNRNDRQIKISGYRIELGEIESRVLETGVDEVIAVLGTNFIKVFYYSNKDIDKDNIEFSVQKKFPHYYRLKFVRETNPLKRTKNGKFDIRFYELN